MDFVGEISDFDGPFSCSDVLRLYGTCTCTILYKYCTVVLARQEMAQEHKIMSKNCFVLLPPLPT